MPELYTTSLFNDPNLVSYYRLSDISDSKGANNLTNTNSVAFNSAKFGNGADFSSNNTNKKLTTGNNLGLAGSSQAISIVGWVLIYNTTDGGFVFFNSTTTADRYLSIKQDGSGNIVWNGAGVVASTPFSDTTSFHHIAVTRDASGNVLGYLDAVQKASFSVGSSGVTTNNFEIGDINGGEFCSSIIDDVGVFSRVLTPAEIYLLFSPAGGITADLI